MDKFDKAVAKAMTPKGEKLLDKKIDEVNELADALYSIRREAQTKKTLNKTRKICNAKDVF